ncbi:LysR family transcriptional regulator [Bradyrhizobium sp. KBS0727]|uniref:LysR family transcriptional regulator n=1 Tax=unclassified Bradyrhizobium TaxID=2631580 RepID=UPI00110DC201|nr:MULTISPECIES: LysR family transcriptional regulator [unclassified Bradyrhizobium]QDW40575.1 LysR family transcriptional regulator [Bradyrhizobium sp. KBS0725]QDW47180.1 LysR family transcriptional regulator [Bradyrhizobium sp. KBS0727]
MNLRQLEYFIAIVEEGSLSKAAERVHIVQPALSQHIKSLEEEFGVGLLFRSSRGVRPTEAGERLVKHARSLLAQFEAMHEFVRGADVEPFGEVRIGVPTTVSPVLSPRLIKEVGLAYPKIKIRILEPMSGYVSDWLGDGKVDIAVQYRESDRRDLKFERVFSEEIVLCGGPLSSPGGGRAPGDTIPFREAVSLPLILPNSGHGLRDLLEELAKKHMCSLHVSMEIDSYGPIKTMIEQGSAFAVLPMMAVRSERQQGLISTWRIVEPEVRRNVFLATPIDRPLSVAAVLVNNLVKPVLLRLVEEKVWEARVETCHRGALPPEIRAITS